MKKSILSFSCIFLINIITVTSQNKYQPNWESIDSRPVPAWFENAKFGIFIHWGVYSVTAWAPTKGPVGEGHHKYAEHYWNKIQSNNPYFKAYHDSVYGRNFKYQDFAPKFKATNFDPKNWADLFDRAGANYVVLTSKHHDGFTLWPSSQSVNWNSVDIGPHRDLCGDLSTAVKKKGLHMGFYYSLLEWYHPWMYSQTEKYIDEHMIPQMKELVTRYEPDILWTDGEWDFPSEKYKSVQFLSWLYNDSKVREKIVVNDRWGKETRSKHGGFYTTEYDEVLQGETLKNGTQRPWEECRGIGNSFGYNKMEDVSHYSSSKQLIHILIEKVAAGGNLLLNVGPTSDGLIPVIMQERLLDIGNWMNENGEAIYDTRMWKNKPSTTENKSHYFTTKGNDLYLIVTQWSDKPITVEGLNRCEEVTMLGYDGKVKYSFGGNKLTITPPALNANTNPSMYAWVYKIKNSIGTKTKVIKKLVWVDEFSKNGLPDSTKWVCEEGMVRNNESQYYTKNRPENARVENGSLIITARKEDYREGKYTSACVNTQTKYEFTRGRIEVCAQLPKGIGVWPAIWTLGKDFSNTNGLWPACGEIDIMENVGFNPTKIHANVHTRDYNWTQGNPRGGVISHEDPTVGFHVYAVDWFKDRMDFYFDDKLYFTCNRKNEGFGEWPFDEPQFLLLNLAIGGSWGGQKGIDDSIFPVEYKIDYVRIYSLD